MATILELAYWTYKHCHIGRVHALSPYLVLFRYAPRAINLGLYAASLWRSELLLLFVGIVVTASDAFNSFVLVPLFRQPVPVASCGWSALYCVPPDATECGGDASAVDCIACGMPSWAAQQLSVFATLVLVHANQFEARTHTLGHTLALTLLVALGSYSYVHFHMNSVEQVLVGSLVGALFGSIGATALYACVYPHFDVILTWPLVRRVGFVNTLCQFDDR